MKRILGWLVPDRFIFVLIATIALASVLPVRGSDVALANLLSSAAVFVIFLLHGIRLPRAEVIDGLKDWRTQGAIALFVYIVIAVTQLRARAAMDKTGARPAVRMWAFPVLTYVTIAFIVFTLGAMALREDQQLNLFLTLGLAAVVIGIGVAKHGFRGGSEDEIIKAVESADTAEVDGDVASSGAPTA